MRRTAVLLALVLGACGGGSDAIGPASVVDLGNGRTYALAAETRVAVSPCTAIAAATFWSATTATPLDWTLGFYGTQLVARHGGREVRGPLLPLTHEPTEQQSTLSFQVGRDEIVVVELRAIAPEGATTQWGGIALRVVCQN